jgi:hypothetical protein
MDVRGYVDSNAREFIDDLKQWLAIPSISADPDRHGDVRRSAEWSAADRAAPTVSFRLVADQDPADVAGAFREYVAARTPAGLAATVTVQPAVRPCHSPITSPAVLAGRRAMQRAFGREVLFTKEGGSGPEADLALLLRGAEASAYLWDELAAADLR